MAKVLENPNPRIYPKLEEKLGHNEQNLTLKSGEYDARGIFELLRHINDPEHPLTLEQLNVVEQSLIEVDNENNEVNVKFTPTIPHCSMATLIGLSIRTQLLRKIPPKFKVSVMITPGTHVAESAVNKQLADKERVAAALENQFLLTVIEQCLDSNLIQNNTNEVEEEDGDGNETGCCRNDSSANESSCCRSTEKEKEKTLNENDSSSCCKSESKSSLNVTSTCCQSESKSTKNDSTCCQSEDKNVVNDSCCHNGKKSTVNDSCCQSENENNANLASSCCQNSS